ncbi:MAG TPA: hypothetical protein ENI39_01465 [Anaerolineae bacterium]|nr:hypothetical protein [Anaerolineae bacterium]
MCHRFRPPAFGPGRTVHDYRQPAGAFCPPARPALHDVDAGLFGRGHDPGLVCRAISAPIYAATGSRTKAFLWSFMSGVAEPIGAGLAALVLMPFLNETVLGVVLSAVAGIMVIISLDELVPVSRSFGEEHLSIVGVVAGMAVMALR